VAENEDSEVLVSCEGISKKFCRNLKKSLWYGVKDGVSEILSGQSSDELRKEEFWALKDVSFELRRGECLGLLGRNGAGKTTLLKVLSGLIKPDQGTVSLKGQIGGLIALGAGFNGILSGRENIRINGSILGYSRDEIEERMQEIIDFAEIPDFIDAPVNTYSSGMSVRLGFAIAAILTKPDVLLLDEVLAVGDIGFTIKCLNAVRDMMKDSAVIFVSHNVQFVSRFCTNVLLMEKGRKSLITSEISIGIERYLCLFKNKLVKTSNFNKGITLSNIKFYQNGEIKKYNDVYSIDPTKSLKISFDLDNNQSNENMVFIMQFNDNCMEPVIQSEKSIPQILKIGINKVSLSLQPLRLNTGHYSTVIAIIGSESGSCYLRDENIARLYSNNKEVIWGKLSCPILCSIN